MKPFTVQSTDAVSVPVHVLTPGSANDPSPPFLMVHATGFHGRTYTTLARALAARTTSTILAPDLRGHGDSPSPSNGRYRWEGFAEDLTAVVEEIGSTGLSAFGHSMGAAILLRVELLRPGTFSRLYLFEPIVFPPSAQGRTVNSPLVEASRRRRSEFPSFERAIERFASKPPLNLLEPACLGDYVRHGFSPTEQGTVTLKLPGVEEADVYRMSLGLDTWEHLPQIKSEVTIAYGQIEGPGPAYVAPLIAEKLPNATIRRYQDLGHFGPLQATSRIAADIRP